VSGATLGYHTPGSEAAASAGESCEVYCPKAGTQVVVRGQVAEREREREEEREDDALMTSLHLLMGTLLGIPPATILLHLQMEQRYRGNGDSIIGIPPVLVKDFAALSSSSSSLCSSSSFSFVVRNTDAKCGGVRGGGRGKVRESKQGWRANQ